MGSLISAGQMLAAATLSHSKQWQPGTMWMHPGLPATHSGVWMCAHVRCREEQRAGTLKSSCISFSNKIIIRFLWEPNIMFNANLSAHDQCVTLSMIRLCAVTLAAGGDFHDVLFLGAHTQPVIHSQTQFSGTSSLLYNVETYTITCWVTLSLKQEKQTCVASAAPQTGQQRACVTPLQSPN